MIRCAPIGMALFLAACGGGGGGDVTPPAQAPVRLEVAPIEIAANASVGELVVTLPEGTAAPALLEVAVELPGQLTLPTQGRLVAARPLVTLDGDVFGGRFVVVCGDAQNLAAAQLTPGALFRLRLQPSAPRQTGTFQVTLRNLRAATAAGEALASEQNPIVVDVTVR